MTVIWDNLGAHHAGDLQEWAASQSWLVLAYLPSYAPELDPVMGLRVLPGRLLGRPRARFDAEEPLLAWAVRFGFIVLAEDAPGELVVGAVGQPWRLAGGRGMAVTGGEEFAAFDQAGYAKMAANFRLAPSLATGPSSSAPRHGSPAPKPPRSVASPATGG